MSTIIRCVQLVFCNSNLRYTGWVVGQEKDVSLFLDRTGQPATQHRDTSRLKNKDTSFSWPTTHPLFTTCSRTPCSRSMCNPVIPMHFFQIQSMLSGICKVNPSTKGTREVNFRISPAFYTSLIRFEFQLQKFKFDFLAI